MIRIMYSPAGRKIGTWIEVEKNVEVQMVTDNMSSMIVVRII